MLGSRGRPRRRIPLALVLLLLLGAAVPAFGSEGGHEDPVASVVLYMALILGAAKLGGDIAVRFRQPAVLGELMAGVVLGNLDLLGLHGLDAVAGDASIDMLARIGVLVLLFEVGLESTVGQMLKVGWSSLLVAVVGVVTPFALGYGAGVVLLPEHGVFVHAFVGATLCATSVGITARVLKDLDRSQTKEARVILGAAVIDDVLGLVILAVVAGAIQAANAGKAMSYLEVVAVLGKAVGFLVGSLVLGYYLSPKLFSLASHLRARGVLLALSLSFCFVLAWAAAGIGLAPIVGAFAAGLILEDVHFKDFQSRGEHTLEVLIHPISSMLVPIFFVLMGMRTELDSFARPGVLGLAAALCAAAIVGKQACGLGVLGKDVDRISVGIGMIPRGEVGLIFANIGVSLTIDGEPVVSIEVFSAVVVMVIVTTLVTPPSLKWSLSRLDRSRGGSRDG